MMKRRNFLSLSAPAAVTAMLPCVGGLSSLHARETYGKWDRKWMNLFTRDLVTWMKEDFAKRAALAEKTLGVPGTCPRK